MAPPTRSTNQSESLCPSPLSRSVPGPPALCHHRGVERTYFRDLLLPVVGVGGMQDGGNSQNQQHHAKNNQRTFHATHLSIKSSSERHVAAQLHADTPLRHMGVGNRSKSREVLRTGGRSGSGNFLGSFGSFCGRRCLAAPLGLRRRGRGFADQFRRHHAGHGQLWPVIIKINRGALLVRGSHDSQAVHIVFDCLSFLHCLHIVLLDHSTRIKLFWWVRRLGSQSTQFTG